MRPLHSKLVELAVSVVVKNASLGKFNTTQPTEIFPTIIHPHPNPLPLAGEGVRLLNEAKIKVATTPRIKPSHKYLPKICHHSSLSRWRERE
jgi:hypothetical protein